MSALKIRLGLLVLAAALLPSVKPAPARAWTCLSSSCPKWCGTVPYGLARPSDDLGDATSESEVRRALDDWTRVSCTNLTNNYTGRSGATAGAADGQSVVGWVESGWPFDRNAIGVTGPRWGGSGCFVEADMQLNGVNFTWTTAPGRGGNVNAYSIALHEGGHYYGLGHSNDSNATMYFAYTGGVSTLNADDETGICTLYPGSGGGPTDCTVSGCPAGKECVSGSCQTVAGDGSVCSSCGSGADCGGGANLCLGYPDGGGYCGKACSTSADCSGTDQCVNVGGSSNQCVRISGGSPDCSSGATPTGCSVDSDCSASQICDSSTRACVARPTTGATLGEPCTGNADCRSGLCANLSSGSVCSQSCDGLDARSCPSGFYCDGEAVGVCGTGLCLTGGPGTTALGGSCSVDTDCQTSMCTGGVCASPCIPGGAISCPSGFLCQTLAAAGCGACKVAGPVGAACSTNDDCASNTCATRDDASFCTDVCARNADCPDGFDCESVGDFSVCAPRPGTTPTIPPGSVGADCASNGECDSGSCTTAGYCTATCMDTSGCPSGFACVATADGTAMVCAREGTTTPRSSGGCGCSVPAATGGLPAGGLASLFGFLIYRRRRRAGAPRR
ncbi:MAG: matrixin family metalloprotease [Deltaproteobacteria bacterium]|nr:matrixin family metalloprotease [Deltaproteobacteria bacterium]